MGLSSRTGDVVLRLGEVELALGVTGEVELPLGGTGAVELRWGDGVAVEVPLGGPVVVVFPLGNPVAVELPVETGVVEHSGNSVKAHAARAKIVSMSGEVELKGKECECQRRNDNGGAVRLYSTGTEDTVS
jgi:hypothetical protein